MKSTVYFWQGFACGRQFQNFPPLHLVITITHGNLPLMENVSYTTFSQVMYEIYIRYVQGTVHTRTYSALYGYVVYPYKALHLEF